MDFESYITWFVDWEWCFSISFNRREKLKTKIEVRPSFSISQNRRSKDILFKIRDFFSCWAIRFSKNDQTYKYEVRSIKDLTKIIIPHFRKFELMTNKKLDFEKFDYICKLISETKHRNFNYLKEIIELSYNMNFSWKKKYKKQELLSIIDKVMI